MLNQKDFAADLILVADPDLLYQRAGLLGIENPPIHVMDHPRDFKSNALNVSPVRLATPSIPGQLDPANGAYVLDCLETAVQLCESDHCQGIVTGPVHKANVNDAGFNFTGHTEWLADRTGSDRVVMLLASSQLKVALATTHLPLRAVADAINRPHLVHTLKIIEADMRRRFGIAEPRILVCGLNPHAGEDGHLGHEEIETIIPAISEAQESGLQVIGPLPADTAFTPGVLADCDVVLAMYHDQGLPVLKYQGFGDAVNITLGLNIPRTSVDHGTALDLAGTGQAEAGSLIRAVELAATMASRG